MGPAQVVPLTSSPTVATRRFGQLAAGGSAKPVTVRISGRDGVYNQPYFSMAFDFDGDGTFDPEIERYLLSEKFVNVGEATYEFVVDRAGDTVSFRPVTPRKPNRLILKTGHPAPDFPFVDLTGAKRRLSDYRGKVVLLDFWGIWCAGCVAAVPQLVTLYERYHSRGFDIIGIEANDSRETVAAFLAAKHMPWTQTLEKDKGSIGALYRIEGWPSAFLIGPDGKFLAANYLAEVDLAVELAKVFPRR